MGYEYQYPHRVIIDGGIVTIIDSNSFTVSSLGCKDVNTENRLITEQDETISFLVSGVNGLDVGSKENNKTYNLFVIKKLDRTLTKFILSLADKPALLPDWGYYRKIGTIIVDGSGNLTSLLQGSIPKIEKGVANGVATLNAFGKVPDTQIPKIAITDVFVVDTIAERDALTVETGDVAIVTDNGLGQREDFIWDGSAWREVGAGKVSLVGDEEISGIKQFNNGIKFKLDGTPSAQAEGLLQWNATDRTLDLGMGEGGIVTQQIGQELFIKVINKSGAKITEGSAVYFDGRLGNRPKIKLAISDSELTSRVMGVVTEDIANNKEGFITTFGYVRQIKTNYATWEEGQTLWVSKDTAGELTNVEPTVPHHSDRVGCVGIVGSAGIGSIFVNINRHQDLEELSDVNGTPLATSGQFPIWDNDKKYFDFNRIYGQFGAVADGNYSEFEADGTLVAKGDATTFRDELGDITRIRVTGTGIAESNTENTMDFQEACNPTNDYLYANIQLNHDRLTGSKIYPHIHYFQNTANLPNMLVQYRWQINGQAKVTTWTNYPLKDLKVGYVSGTINGILGNNDGISAPVNDSISCILQIRLTRDRTNSLGVFGGADNFSGDVPVTSFDIHVQTDTLGSRQEYIK